MIRFNLSLEELKNSYETAIAPKIKRQMDAYIDKY
jgi:hypothetical protein